MYTLLSMWPLLSQCDLWRRITSSGRSLAVQQLSVIAYVWILHWNLFWISQSKLIPVLEWQSNSFINTTKWMSCEFYFNQYHALIDSTFLKINCIWIAKYLGLKCLIKCTILRPYHCYAIYIQNVFFQTMFWMFSLKLACKMFKIHMQDASNEINLQVQFDCQCAALEINWKKTCLVRLWTCQRVKI